jgi:prepilin-type N-terminal cleavage/methylation domain-containing protein
MRDKGFTVIELLVVILLGGLLVLAGVPAFMNYLRAARFNGAVNQVVSDAQQARYRAVSTGWQFRLIGFNSGAAHARRNQYRLIARRTTAAGWPSETAAPFESSTQSAGPWVDVNDLYPGATLNPTVMAGDGKFFVSFDARGARFGVQDFDPLVIGGETGTTRSVDVSAVGSLSIQ